MNDTLYLQMKRNEARHKYHFFVAPPEQWRPLESLYGCSLVLQYSPVNLQTTPRLEGEALLENPYDQWGEDEEEEEEEEKSVFSSVQRKKKASVGRYRHNKDSTIGRRKERQKANDESFEVESNEEGINAQEDINSSNVKTAQRLYNQQLRDRMRLKFDDP